MKPLIFSVLLAATLSAQTPESTKHWLDRIKPTMLCAGHCDVTGYSDGNGALEAFYVKPSHRSIFKTKKFWIGVGIAAGSGVFAGYMASRGGSKRFVGQPATVQPSVVAPIFEVTRIGIGGPGIPVTVVKGGAN